MDITSLALIDALALVTNQYAKLARDLVAHAATPSPEFEEIAAKVKEAHEQFKRVCADLERQLVWDHKFTYQSARTKGERPS